MDFGDILDKWEKLSSRPGGLDRAAEVERRAREESAIQREKRDGETVGEVRKAGKPSPEDPRRAMESWLARHAVVDKDGGGESAASGAEEARRLAALRPGARLDLHGMTVAEAQLALGNFLENAARRGIEKVLVITGKGNHSAGGAVLAKAVRGFLEANPRAGRFGTADRADGGSGALWVVLRKSVGRGA